MTCRQRLNRSVWKANVAVFSGMLIFISGFFVLNSSQSEWSYGLLIVGVCLFFGGMHYAHRFGLRCPACHTSLYHFLMKPGVCWWLSEAVKVCPYCSNQLDEEWTEQTAIMLPPVSANLETDEPVDLPIGSARFKEDSVEEENSEEAVVYPKPVVTGRSTIEQHFYRNRRLFWRGFGLIFLSLALMALWDSKGWLIITIPGFAICMISDLREKAEAFCCPWCNYNLRSLFMLRSVSQPDYIKVCPHCSRNLDDEVAQHNNTMSSLPKYPE